MGSHPLGNAGHESIAPHRIGRFVVVARIGAGAMGVVHAAFDPKLDRKVAIKLVDMGRIGTEVGDAQARLEREARANATLSHPNVVTVYDVGMHEGRVFLAMEYVEGTTLTQWLRNERRSWREVVRMFAAVGRGLAAAHDAGLVHRDFKPDNVLVGNDGRPRVADFGLARPVEGWSSRDVARALASGSSIAQGVTVDEHEGEVCGTPAYMAPEQYVGMGVGPHSDQFGFCAALYEGVLGQRPFQGKNITEIAYAVLEGNISKPDASPRVPRSLMKLILRGLAVEPGNRHESMHAVVRTLERLTAARRRRALAIGAGVVSMTGLGIGYQAAMAQKPEPCAGVTDAMRGAWEGDERDAVLRSLHDAKWEAQWASIDGRLQRYVEGWRDQRLDACEATRVRNEASEYALDLRFACLDRAAASFDVVTTELADLAGTNLDPEQSLELLVDLSQCEDLDTLAALEDALGARDGGPDRRELLDLHRRFTEARAKMYLGKPGWPAMAEQLHTDAAEHPRYRAHADIMLGSVAQRAGRHEEAETHFGAAMHGAKRGRDSVLAVDAMLRRAELALERGQITESHLHLEYARATYMAVAEIHRARLQPLLDRLEGSLAWRAGRYEEARTKLLEAIAHIEEGPWERDSETARRLGALYGELGVAYKETGSPDDALAALARSLAIFEKAEGTEPLMLARTRQNLGINATQLRRFDEAQRQFEEAAKIFDTLGPDVHPAELGALRSNRGWLERERGKLDVAREHQRAAWELCRTSLGELHADCAYPLVELATIARLEGRFDEALEWISQAGNARIAGLGDDHPETAFTLSLLAWILLDKGELEAAQGPVTAALAIFERHPEANPIDRATARYVEARVLHAQDSDAGEGRLEQVEDEIEALGARGESLRLELAQWRIARRRGHVGQEEASD